MLVGNRLCSPVQATARFNHGTRQRDGLVTIQDAGRTGGDKSRELDVRIAAIDNVMDDLPGRFLGQAVEIDMDSNGRLLVPPELRAAIGLEKQAMLIGQMHRFEIWKAESWLEEDGTLDPDALPESVQELSF